MASKKLRSVQSGDGDDLKVDMSPMIDMVFLLLIFFLVNATLIIVEMDKKIMVPIAKYSTKQSDKLGRIVINVYNDEDAADGRFRQASGKDIFKDDADMVDWIKKQKEMWDDRGQKPRLHLRADEDVHFTYVRRAIRAAATAGVNEVIFVSLWTRNK
ncbi:MAG: biopolymer transporter ExbD [Roseibacillus sp.]|jgi:biopolymer transport protein ExbD